MFEKYKAVFSRFEKYKKVLIISLVVVVIISGWVYYRSTAWNRYFTVTYIKSEFRNLPSGETSCKSIYEIKNNTNRSFDKITVVFKCKSLSERWKYETNLYYLEPGETVELIVFSEDIKEALGRKPILPEYRLYKIKT